MEYRPDKYGAMISQLGYGCMRFTKKGASIDFDKAEREVMRAIDSGVNYFDTAYLYPGSEACLGEILEKNQCREKVLIATKLPQYMIRSAKAIEKTFQEELSRLKTDHVDYYLMHMFTDPSEWEKLQAFGIEEWIRKHKEDGSIRNIGFSFHGDSDTFLKVLGLYDWDICQIQYNYLDETSQAGRIGLQAAADRGIPVVIMEPLRGGKLVKIPKQAEDALEKSGLGYTPAELGLRWLWDQPEVTCVLSGMNSMDMVEENIRVASDAKAGHFGDAEFALVDQIKGIIRAKERVGCTGCRYCMPCPAGVDIPGNFYYYNLMYLEKKNAARIEFVRNMGLQKKPGFASQCIGCGKCETQCPQKIEIRRELKKADRHLRPPHYKVAIRIVRAVKKRI